jgi:hypothetical protein
MLAPIPPDTPGDIAANEEELTAVAFAHVPSDGVTFDGSALTTIAAVYL